MKKNVATFIYLLFITTTGLKAQYYQLPFGSLVEQDCPANPELPANTLENWYAYQTLDNTWDGPIDTDACINLYFSDDVFNISRLTLSQESPTIGKPIFLEFDFTNLLDVGHILGGNWLYEVNGSGISINDTSHLTLGSNCEDGLCTGVFFQIEIPNEDNTGYNYRNYRYSYLDSPSDFPDFSDSDLTLEPPNVATSYLYGDNMPCIATEYFERNKLTRFLVKLVPNTFESFSVQFSGAPYFQPIDSYSLEQLTSIEATQTLGPKKHQIEYKSKNYLLMYGDESQYPSPEQKFFIEVFPPANAPQSTTPDTIDIIIGEGASLTHQPYTELIGAKVSEDSEDRHIVNIINAGEGYCYYFDFWIIEKTFFNGDSYIHQGGNLSLPNPQSCYAFGKGSKLKVADNFTLNYGNQGVGMLMLKTGGSIEIGKNAELIIDGELLMAEFPEDDGPQQIYMTLNEGSTLTFTKNARLTNAWSKDGSMKLNVVMNGGVLDDSGLSAKDRQLLNRIYPLPETSSLENLQLGQSNNGLNLHGFLSNDLLEQSLEGSLTVAVYDFSGRLLFQENPNIQGNYFDVNLPNNLPNLFLVELRAGQDRLVRKMTRF